MEKEFFYLLYPGIRVGIPIRPVWVWVDWHRQWLVVVQGIRWVILMRKRVVVCRKLHLLLALCSCGRGDRGRCCSV